MGYGFSQMKTNPLVVVLVAALSQVAVAGPKKGERTVENPVATSDGGIAEQLSVLPLRGSVLFPGSVLPLNVGREKTITLVKDALARKADIAVITQVNEAVESPTAKDLYTVGVRAQIVQFVQNGDSYSLVLQGTGRVRVSEWLSEAPFFQAKVVRVVEEQPRKEDQPEVATLMKRLVKVSGDLILSNKDAPQNAVKLLEAITEPGVLADIAIGNSAVGLSDKQNVLASTSILARMKLALTYLDAQWSLLSPEARARAGSRPTPAKPMTWQSLLVDTREVTLATIETMVKSYKQLNKDVRIEGALRRTDGSLQIGKDELPRRVDVGVLSNSGINPLTAVTGGLKHDPIEFAYDGKLAVSLRDFAWDSSVLATDGDKAKAATAVKEWFWRWFDKDDKKGADTRGFHGVVHFVAFSKDLSNVDVDFGSAPVEAFEDLLRGLSRAGVSKVNFVRGRQSAQENSAEK